jgi:hypothetical protein
VTVGTATPERAAASIEPSLETGGSTLAAARAALAIAFGPVEARGFAVRLWDGSIDAPPGPAPQFTLVVRRPGALRRALLPPSELALVEAYLRDDLDAEGDLGAAGRLGDLAASRLRTPRALLALVRALRALPTDDTAFEAGDDPGGSAPRAARDRERKAHSVRR